MTGVVGSVNDEEQHVRGQRRISGGTRRRRRILSAFCAMVVAIVTCGLPVYIRPQADPLRPADAILVLGGYDWSRFPYGIELGVEGWAPQVVLSDPYGPDNTWLTQACRTPQPGIELTCFVPDPPTTQGEARALRRMAAEHQWQHVIVVTATPHISRARYILERCYDGALTMVASPGATSPLRWAFEYIYQTAGYVKSFLQRGC